MTRHRRAAALVERLVTPVERLVFPTDVDLAIRLEAERIAAAARPHIAHTPRSCPGCGRDTVTVACGCHEPFASCVDQDRNGCRWSGPVDQLEEP